MEPLRDLHVVRALQAPPQLRAGEAAQPAAEGAGEGQADDLLGQMIGHFSVFNAWYRIKSWWEGDFYERTVPGAFSKTMAERRSQIVVAFDHGWDPVIGDKVLGAIDDLREDGHGAFYDVGLLDTSYNRDLLPALRRGLYGSSFRFQVLRDEWDEEPGTSDHNPEGIPERTIKEVRLFEFGPVTYPASPAATAGMRSAGAVSLTDRYYDHLRSRDKVLVDRLRSRVLQHRTPHSPAAAPQGTAGAEGAAPAPPTAPAQRSHPDGYSARERRALLHPFLETAS